jgi:hypothetical protein
MAENSSSKAGADKPSKGEVVDASQAAGGKVDTKNQTVTAVDGPRDMATNPAVPDGVDPRLDNRVGDQRPVDTGVKPQQVVGGFPGDDREFEHPPSPGSDDVVGNAVGHTSVGPHGRGEAPQGSDADPETDKRD